MNTSPILVSVCMITYNHESYIRQAIEGVLMQKGNFEIELVIGEDCSPDKTRRICEEYSSRYSNIRLLPSEKNLGVIPNLIRTLESCTGDYIAFCEGDDYWIDPNKLQKQVDFLNKNNDYGLCYSKAKVYKEKEKTFKKSFGVEALTFDDLLVNNTISTPTVLLRRELYDRYNGDIQPENKDWIMGDYPLWLWVAHNSKIKFFDAEFAVYRVLENSASHSTDYKKDLAFLNNYHKIKVFYINKYGHSNMENRVWQRYYSNKAYLFLLKNEKKIDELLSEIKEFETPTLKLRVLTFLLEKKFLRLFLKLYWKRNS